MKTVLFVSISLMAFVTLNAQSDPGKTIRSGKVIYEEVIKLDIHLDGDAAQFAASLPKERKSAKTLLFNESASLYTNQKSEAPAADEVAGEGGAAVMIRMDEPDNKMYTDFTSKKQFEQKEFMTRMFLIEKELGISDWKFTGNERNILGYACQEATRAINDSTQVVAWYTPAVPIASGPGEYLNLPGLVLAVDLDNGKRTIMATSIEPMEIGAKQLAKPKEGKKVTEAEYKSIVDEKMKEMGVQGSGNGVHMMIRIER
ncbi:MAG: GLPGLI family protein [Bacteroidales bacterium]|nr:GLPGLI family protein [Bacteroidales bacterium]